MAVFLRRVYDTTCKGRGYHSYDVTCCARETICYSEYCPSDGEEGSVWMKDVFPPFPQVKHFVRGYCRGLFCLEYNCTNRMLVIWNPSTNYYTCIPPADYRIPPCPKHNQYKCCKAYKRYDVCGLGFDPSSQDYKVVNYVEYKYSYDNRTHCTRELKLFSLKDDCWKAIPAEEIHSFNNGGHPMYANGFLHWNCLYEQKQHIVSLDIGTEKLSVCDLPNTNSTKSMFILTKLKDEADELGVVTYSLRHCSYRLFKFWTLTDNGKQGKKWTVKNECKVYVDAHQFVGCCRNGELLLVKGYIDAKLFVYDFDAQKLWKFDDINDFGLRSFHYMVSTVPLKFPNVYVGSESRFSEVTKTFVSDASYSLPPRLPKSIFKRKRPFLFKNPFPLKKRFFSFNWGRRVKSKMRCIVKRERQSFQKSFRGTERTLLRCSSASVPSVGATG